MMTGRQISMIQGKSLFRFVDGRFLGLCPLLLLSFILLAGCGIKQAEEVQETANFGANISVSNDFQAFYDVNGGVRVFGYPLTEPYTDLQNDRLVQYFQRMRLEFDPSIEAIFVSPLGSWAISSQDEVLASSAPEETQVIKDEFLAFYQSNQGESLFGPPISQELDEGGTRVQYFRNGRLEWHPDAPLGYRVQVGPLGEAHYRQVGRFEDPGRNRPLDSAAVREAAVSANLSAPILFDGERQVVYVDVETPEGQRPVIGATVDLAIIHDGQTELITLPSTDGAGHTQGALPLSDVEPGQKVQIIITASAPGGATIGTASQSFKTWW